MFRIPRLGQLCLTLNSIFSIFLDKWGGEMCLYVYVGMLYIVDGNFDFLYSSFNLKLIFSESIYHQCDSSVIFSCIPIITNPIDFISLIHHVKPYYKKGAEDIKMYECWELKFTFKKFALVRNLEIISFSNWNWDVECFVVVYFVFDTMFVYFILDNGNGKYMCWCVRMCINV